MWYKPEIKGQIKRGPRIFTLCSNITAQNIFEKQWYCILLFGQGMNPSDSAWLNQDYLVFIVQIRSTVYTMT